jgi:hypothetical protein
LDLAWDHVEQPMPKGEGESKEEKEKMKRITEKRFTVFCN